MDKDLNIIHAWMQKDPNGVLKGEVIREIHHIGAQISFCLGDKRVSLPDRMPESGEEITSSFEHESFGSTELCIVVNSLVYSMAFGSPHMDNSLHR